MNMIFEQKIPHFSVVVSDSVDQISAGDLWDREPAGERGRGELDPAHLQADWGQGHAAVPFQAEGTEWRVSAEQNRDQFLCQMLFSWFVFYKKKTLDNCYWVR